MEGPPVELSDIQRFYKNSTVFLTGATGFIGKLVLEKVLRALPVRKVFILVRAKKDVAAAKRVSAVFESPVFDQLKRSNPTALKKVEIIEGDCTLPMLGMSEHDIEQFLNEIDVILHCAATVRFDETLSKATRTNVRATRDLIVLAKKLNKLKTFVYVGTAFSNSNRTEIREQFYPSKIAAENLIAAVESLDDECLGSMTETMIADWPNTYTFTKQVTEDYINREGKNLPICIVRPAIVVSTLAEPVSAFVDNMYTLAGFVMANVMGISRITYYKNTDLNIVPADFVVNECLAAGWQTGVTFKKQLPDVPIYHVGSGVDNPIVQDDVYLYCDYYCKKIPSPKLPTFPLYFRTTCKYNYLFWRFFFHTLVSYILDFTAKLQGKPLMYIEGIKRLHNFQTANEPFTTKNYFIHMENTDKLLKKMSFKDRELFNFDVRTIVWENYFAQYTRGLRIYLLQDPLDTIPEGAVVYNSHKRNMIITLVLVTIFLYVAGKIFLFRALPFVFKFVVFILRSLVC